MFPVLFPVAKFAKLTAVPGKMTIPNAAQIKLARMGLASITRLALPKPVLPWAITSAAIGATVAARPLIAARAAAIKLARPANAWQFARPPAVWSAPSSVAATVTKPARCPAAV